MKEKLTFPEIKVLDPKNLDWEKAKRWGRLVHTGDGLDFYQWQGKVYILPEEPKLLD